jgi:hypothetical protein
MVPATWVEWSSSGVVAFLFVTRAVNSRWVLRIEPAVPHSHLHPAAIQSVGCRLEQIRPLEMAAFLLVRDAVEGWSPRKSWSTETLPPGSWMRTGTPNSPAFCKTASMRRSSIPVISATTFARTSVAQDDCFAKAGRWGFPNRQPRQRQDSVEVAVANRLECCFAQQQGALHRGPELESASKPAAPRVRLERLKPFRSAANPRWISWMLNQRGRLPRLGCWWRVCACRLEA